MLICSSSFFWRTMYVCVCTDFFGVTSLLPYPQSADKPSKLTTRTTRKTTGGVRQGHGSGRRGRGLREGGRQQGGGAQRPPQRGPRAPRHRRRRRRGGRSGGGRRRCRLRQRQRHGRTASGGREAADGAPGVLLLTCRDSAGGVRGVPVVTQGGGKGRSR